MTERTIWRYLSLAKYVELLSTQSLFFPKASLFADSTEGKWIGHALRWDISQGMDALESDIQTLEKLLATVGNDQDAVLREAKAILASRDGHLSSLLREVLGMAMAATPSKRVEVLSSMQSHWRETQSRRLLEREALAAESCRGLD